MSNFKILLESILKESQTVVHKPQSETEFDDIISSSNNHKIIMHGNKELYVVPDANHTDLYDNKAKIPFDRIDQFFKENL